MYIGAFVRLVVADDALHFYDSQGFPLFLNGVWLQDDLLQTDILRQAEAQ